MTRMNSPDDAPITPEEMARRLNVFRQAEATLAISGIETPEDVRALATRYVRGEIAFDTYSALCKEAIQALGNPDAKPE